MTHPTDTLEKEALDRLQRNLLCLKPFIRPSLLERLTQPEGQNIDIENVGTPELNLLVDGNPVYVPNATEFSKEQVKAYAEQPNRLIFDIDSLNQGIDDEIKSEQISFQIIDDLRKIPHSELSAIPLSDTIGGYFLSLGLGLGLHLIDLVKQHNFRDLIIYDPFLDMMRCSLKAIEWSEIVEVIESRGGRIKFVFEQDTDIASQAIMAYLREENFTLIEHSQFYRHYPSPLINETLTKISQLMRDLIVYNGWLEDEMIHFRNGMRNFLSHDLYLLDHPLNFDELLPAYIVGSGPSLNHDIEQIRKMQDKAVIISCGSSIRILLSHGIKPDFHCELENVFTTVPVLAEVRSKFDLSGITLIASSTVHPAVFKFFDNHIVFFREGGGAVRWMQQDCKQLDHASPSCTNVGIRTARQLGFKEIYLFGMDFGSVDPDQHHADGSIYTSLENATEKDRIDEMQLQIEKYPLTTAGNFRDEVHTSPLMIMMRNSVELLAISDREGNFYNCSDGAHIAGTVPFSSRDLSASGTIEKSNVLAKLYSSLKHVKKGTFYDVNHIQAFVESLSVWNSRFESILLNKEHQNFEAFHDEIRELCDSRLPTGGEDQLDRATRIIMSGTILRIMHFIRFIDCRLPKEERQSYLKQAKHSLHQNLDALFARQINVANQYLNFVKTMVFDPASFIDEMNDADLAAILNELSFTAEIDQLNHLTKTLFTAKRDNAAVTEALAEAYTHLELKDVLNDLSTSYR